MTSIKYYIFSLALLVSFSQSGAQQLTLNDAITLAQANNPELKSSQLEIEKAGQQKVIARSLFLPSVSAGAQANHYFMLPAFFGFGETNEAGKIPYGRFGGKDQLVTFVSALQPIFNPTGFPSLQRAQLLQQQNVISAIARQTEILSQVKMSYLQIVILNERLKLVNESINRNKRALQDSKSLFLQGKGLRVDTLRAYTSVKNLEPDLTRISYALETSKLQLKSLIGIDSLQITELSDSLTVPASEDLADEATLYEQVMVNNPEYRMLKLEELITTQQARIASASRLPVLSVVAQYQIQSQTNHFEYGNAFYPNSSFAGLQLSIPVFTGLSTNAKVKNASIAKEQASLQVLNRQSQLRTKIHQVIANIREASLRLETTTVVQETAKISYNIIHYRYKNGIASRIELTDAELALSTAQSNYLEAVYDYIAARIELNKLKGTWED